jgi:hypothetical protein
MLHQCEATVTLGFHTRSLILDFNAESAIRPSPRRQLRLKSPSGLPKSSGVFLMSMADRDGFIWYDGKLVPWREATTHVLTHSLHYGHGVFEGVRAYNTEIGTAIYRLKEHTERLFNSAYIYHDEDALQTGRNPGSAEGSGTRQQS